MSGRLIHIYMADGATKVDAPEDGKVALVWKAVLRTGTWKLRPGPGGVKLHSPIKVFRDKAPKGHLSMSAIKANFEDGAVENVHVPIAQPGFHAGQDVMDNAGFVRKLAIQDVTDAKGKITSSVLWAGMEITEPDVAGKIERGTIPSVSGGILFDYERTEDGKKFDQVMDHCCLTPKPWINGTGGFRNSLPEGVMASEPTDLPYSELEFASATAEYTSGEDNLPEPAEGTVVWRPEDGYSFTRGRVQRALDDFRRSTMATIRRTSSIGDNLADVDVPYWRCEDVSDVSGGAGKALICAGYSEDKTSWVAYFKDDGESMSVDPFTKWVETKPQYVAASEFNAEALEIPTIELARDALTQFVGKPEEAAVKLAVYKRYPELDPKHKKLKSTKLDLPPFQPITLAGASLQQAREARAARRASSNHTTGGPMGTLTELLSGVDLSQLPEERREAILREDAERERERAELAQFKSKDNEQTVVEYCGSADGEVKGKLDKLGLDDPGIKAYVRKVLLADDGGPVIELSETTAGGAEVKVERTASEILRGFIDVMPKDDKGKVTLSEQARRLPGDTPTPVKPEVPSGEHDDPDDKRTPQERSAAFSSEFASELGIPAEVKA